MLVHVPCADEDSKFSYSYNRDQRDAVYIILQYTKTLSINRQILNTYQTGVDL